MSLIRIPTPIVDKNGKQTTVHKRDASSGPDSKILGKAAPTLNSKPRRKRLAKNDEKMVGVVWKSGAWGVNAVNAPEGSFLHRAGLTQRIRETIRNRMSGEESIRTGELYEFLSLGITPCEAAMLKVLGVSMEDVKTLPQFQEALPGNLSRIIKKDRHEIVDTSTVIGLMQERGFNTNTAASILDNGLHDGFYENTVLDEDQLFELFKRFKYEYSIDSEKETVVSKTMDAIMDGRFPFAICDKGNGVERVTMSRLLEVLYPDTERLQSVLSESDRQNLIDNPEDIVGVAQVMSKLRVKSYDGVGPIYTSVKNFGAESCLKHDVELMNARLRDGSFVGPEGAAEVESFIQHFNWTLLKDRPNSQLRGEYSRSGNLGARAVLSSSSDYSRTRDVEFGDIVEMRRAGATVEEISTLLHDKELSSAEALAVYKGDVIASVADGWL